MKGSDFTYMPQRGRNPEIYYSLFTFLLVAVFCDVKFSVLVIYELFLN